MRALVPLLLVVLLAPAVAGDAAPAPARIAVLDSGIEPTHPEFDAGQVVAWRDFVNGRAAPYDDQGHGTATASLAAGHNRGACGAEPKLSYAPGAPLIVAKVLNHNGSLPSRQMLADAVDWAVARGASVISISIGSQGGLPPGGDAAEVEAAVRRAADAGVLVFVSAGNGRTHGAAGVGLVSTPWFSWARSFSDLDEVIAVGSQSRTGIRVPPSHNLDPDVASWGYGTCVARQGGAYGLGSGTSFSTPLVAGMAAGAIDAARAAGQPDDAAHIRRVVLHSATNSPVVPATVEGLGFLLEREWPRIVAHASAGTVPDYDAQGAHAALDRRAHEAVLPILREPPTSSP